MRAGRGQSIQIAVAQMRTLLPSPEKTSIVLVTGGERQSLRPTANSAVNPVIDDPTDFAILEAVLPAAVTGRVTVHVLNPELGEPDGLSGGVDIEILDEIASPRIIEIAEASVADLLPLSTLRAQMLAAGSEFPDYDPKYRYLSIRAEGLDPNPNNVLVQYKQDNIVVTLKYADFSLRHGTLRIVRVPESIHAGRVEVIVANRSAGRAGPPASVVLVLPR
jgi:hypothetical protein